MSSLASLIAHHLQLSVVYAKQQEDAQEWVILHLLQAELRNHRLIQGLHAAGLVAGDFYTDLHRVVFALMGLPAEWAESNELLNGYWDLLQKTCTVPLEEFHTSLPDLAKEVWTALQAWKEPRT